MTRRRRLRAGRGEWRGKCHCTLARLPHALIEHQRRAPGPQPACCATYYAAFVIDLHGNNIEAMLP